MLRHRSVLISITDVIPILLALELHFMVDPRIFPYLAPKATPFGTGFRRELLIRQTVPFSLACHIFQATIWVHHMIGEAATGTPLCIPILACAPDVAMLLHDPRVLHHQPRLPCPGPWPSSKRKLLAPSAELEPGPKSHLRVRLRSQWMY
jgi:hypothetical protein